MARRATYFFDVHKTKSPRLLISGGWEYSDPDGLQAPNAETLGQLSKAYEKLQYDIAFIGRDESRILKQLEVPIDTGRLSSAEAPFSIHEINSGHRIGIIRFPSLPVGEDIPSPRLIRQIETIIKQERPNVDMIIALTDWGWVGEREYIGQSPELMPDLLLGSGYGSGVIGRFDSERRCAWYRPYDKGRTVVEVRIFSWPDHTKPAVWEKTESIQSQSIGLGDKYLDNPDIDALFQ